MITAVLSESRERTKVSFLECLRYLFSKWDHFSVDIGNDAQIQWSVASSDSDKTSVEFVLETKKVRKADFSDDDRDSIVNRKLLGNPLKHSSIMIMSVEHQILIKYERKLSPVQSRTCDHWAKQKAGHPQGRSGD